MSITDPTVVRVECPYTTVFDQEKADILAVNMDNARWLATGDALGTVRLWDVSFADPADSARVLGVLPEPILQVAVAKNGQWLAALSSPNSEGISRLAVWSTTSK